MSGLISQQFQYTGEGLSGFVIEQTAKRLKKSFQQALTQMEAGITADQWVVLDLLMNKGPLNQLEICQYLAKDAPTVTRIIDLLAKKQFLQRTTDPADRRRFSITLTQKGNHRHQELISNVKLFRQKHFQSLSSDDIGHLLRILEKINFHIQDS
jgi:DNA-binding MarR family transcriptional regulator